MSVIKFYQNDNSEWIYTNGLTELEYTALMGTCRRIVDVTNARVGIVDLLHSTPERDVYLFSDRMVSVTDIAKSETTVDDVTTYEYYESITDFKDTCCDFFVNASDTGGMDNDTYDPQEIGGDVFDRSNHTGVQTVSTISDFDSEVTANAAVALNTAKTGITTSQATAITTNTAKTGITTSQAAAITTNTAKVTAKWFDDGTNEIYSNKFTKIGGTGAPAVKQVLITGTTGSTNTTTSYTTNISKANIISFTVQVSDSYGNWIPPSFGTAGSDTQWYKAYIGSGGKLYINVLSESSAVYGCAFSCLITYTE